MPRINIVHATEYTYRNSVGLLRHTLMVRPRDSHDLRLHDATLSVDPPPGTTRWAHEVFGSSICLLEWPDTLRTPHLRIVDLPPPVAPGPCHRSLLSLESCLTERQLPDPNRTADA